MPPKRKHKATKAKPSTTSKTAAKDNSNKTAGGIRTSSIKRRHSSLAANAKPSRLQPSEPLHMTTRAASRAASNTASPVAANSPGNSRRSSLTSSNAQSDDGQDSDAENERPVKRARLSTESGSPQEEQQQTQSPAQVNDEDVDDDAHPPAAPEKDEPSTPPPPASPVASPSPSPNKTAASIKRRRSSASVPSDEVPRTGDPSHHHHQHHPNGVTTKSPLHDAADASPQPRKRRKVAEPAEPAADSFADQPPELTDSSTPAGSPEKSPEVEINAQLPIPPANGDTPAKAAKRLPGRRRQPHPDVNIETDLRRQLHLKMGYRSIAKALKPVLVELAERTINNVENDPDFHKQYPEYEHVTSELDKRLQDRLAVIENEKRIKLEQLDRVTKAQEEYLQKEFQNRFRDFQDDALVRCQHKLMKLLRNQAAQDGEATEDEDNIIPPTRKDYIKPSEDFFEDEWSAKYGSRSRPYIETERQWEHFDARSRLEQMRQDFMQKNEGFDDDIAEIPGGFANFIGPDRSVTMAAYNISTLADAAHEVETGPPPPPEPPKVIPNEQAEALFSLASLASERPLENPVKPITPAPPMKTEAVTPSQKPELLRQASPFPSIASDVPPMETSNDSPAKAPQTAPDTQPTPPVEANGVQGREPSVAREAPVKITTNKIQDLLNNDHDPPPRKREPRSRMTESTPSVSPAMRESTPHEQRMTPSNGALRLDNIVHSQEQAPYKAPTPSMEAARPATRSPPPSDQFWSSKRLHELTPDTNLSEKNPLSRIRQMLDSTHGKTAADRPAERPGSDRPDGSSSRRDSFERAQMAPPRPFTAQERRGSTSESRRPSLGYSAAPSPQAAPAYMHSPHAQHAQYAQPPRHNSFDQGHHPHYMSGPQQPPPPAGYGPPQAQPSPYQPDYSRGPPPPNAPQLPPFNPNLPMKPQTGPQNFRFAHYDGPNGPQQQVPRPPTANYPPAPHPPVPAPQGPPPPHQTPYPGPPGPQLQFAVPYSGPQPYPPPPAYVGSPGYVPVQPQPQPYPNYAPGPPPPPPQGYVPGPPPTPAQPYPPLKIHQYGGTPILPANMAPQHHPPQPPPPPPPQQQQQPYPQGGAPSQPPETGGGPSGGNGHGGEGGRGGRRKYRSYAGAAGHEFRNYTGPSQVRRRGGGSHGQ